MSATHQSHSFTYDTFPDKQSLPESYRQLVEAAEAISLQAYAPYSHFQVGAALRLADGAIVSGNNQENAAYPSGLCAERTALFYAGAQYPDTPIEALAVVARPMSTDLFIEVAPCGSCRQVMLESENRQTQPITLILQGPQGSFRVLPSVSVLLPFSFTAASLLG